MSEKEVVFNLDSNGIELPDYPQLGDIVLKRHSAIPASPPIAGSIRARQTRTDTIRISPGMAFEMLTQCAELGILPKRMKEWFSPKGTGPPTEAEVLMDIPGGTLPWEAADLARKAGKNWFVHNDHVFMCAHKHTEFPTPWTKEDLR